MYLSVTPLIYFALLIILEEGLFNKLYVRMFGQGLRNGCEIMDEQVKKEKHMAALEIRKLKDRGMSSRMRFICLNTYIGKTTGNDT